ncbi:endothelin-converting enzyme 1-like isoform X2 [Dermacentor variabilis]|uniref:endothelin-converting enzyme 1-like isoform X2 n=1 Tax=Dermacentor variabilis TaxID=34621 RepID=UPI003F5C6FC9
MASKSKASQGSDHQQQQKKKHQKQQHPKMKGKPPDKKHSKEKLQISGQQALPSTTPRARAKKMLASVVVLLVFFCFMAFTSVALLKMWWLAPTMGTCTTPGCIEHAKALRAAMNSSVQPCSDFYSFSCGSWKPVGRHRSVIETIFARSFDIAVQQLERDANDSDLPIAQLYFQSCLAEHSDTSLKEEVRKFAQFKRDLGLFWPEEWPENGSLAVPPLKVLINMSINWNINPIFKVRAMPGYKGRRKALFIEQGLLNPKWGIETVEEMNRSVTEHCAYFEAPAPTLDQLNELKGAHKAVVDATLSFTPDPRDEERMELKDIDERTKSKKDKWQLYVNEIFFPDYKWEPQDVVLVQHSNILSNIDHLLESMEDKPLRLGIAWVFIRMNLWTVTGNARLRYNGSDTELALRRKTACLAHVAHTFGLVVSTTHLRARFPQHVRDYVGYVFENVKSQYRKRSADATWIDESVKTKLKVKMSENLDLDSLPGSAFFSNFTTGSLYKDFPKESAGSFFDNFVNVAKAFRKKLASDEFVTTFSKTLGDGRVATSYSYYYNSVYFAVGALEPPLFHVEGSFAITYGSLGTLLATSMARAFDDRGIMYDKGEESPWWSSGRDAYKDRLKCDLKAGTSRSGEDAARASSLWLPVLGLRASYAAYRAAIKAEGLVEVFRLKGLEKYTDEQVFFMTYCLMTCAVGNNGDDCNVPVRQMHKFAHAFQCADGTPMNPSEKCAFF